MVMDFVAGGDFYARLCRTGCVSEPEARLYMAELILALEHLHGLGIVYRDLKPENILIDELGHVKLTDFGLSRCVIDAFVLFQAGARALPSTGKLHVESIAMELRGVPKFWDHSKI